MSMQLLYVLLAGIAGSAALSALLDPAHPSRWRSTAFFGLLGLLLVGAGLLPPAWTGAGVLLLILLGSSGLRRAAAPELPDQVDANLPSAPRLFWPILMLPLLSVLGALCLRQWPAPGVPEARQPLIALALAALLTLGWALWSTRTRARQVVPATAGLLDAIGWALILPLLLAVLGSLLAQAGVASALSQLASQYLWVDSRLVCILAYGLGMAGLTMLTGNAFAAFPVLMAAIGVPFLIVEHGAHPAPLAAIGMLCGYCGTLLTPMAANFNLVPAALLDLPDRHAVIKAQVATALPLLGCNLLLLHLLV